MLPSAGVCEVAVILKRLRDWLGVLAVAIGSTACGYHSPAAPTPPAAISTTAPFALSLGASIGQGREAGHAVVTALVQNIQGARMANVPVTFATDVGVIAPTQVTTEADGTASATVTADSTATVIVQAGTLTAKLLVVSQPVPSPPPSSPPPEPVPVPPPLPPPPPPNGGTPYPYYTVTLTASTNALMAFQSATLSASVTQNNGAPMPSSYAWDCTGTGTTITTTAGASVSCQYLTAGTFTPKVTVTGGAAAGIATGAPITVTALAPLLVSIATLTPTPAIGAPVTFTAMVTTTGAPTTNALTWEWNFGESASSTFGAVETGPTPHSTTFTTGYGSSGVKTITVRVTDPLTLRAATNSRTVTVP
jgi:PKD domain-containing protein